MPASPPTAVPSQYDATQFHSEFGYLAPTIRFRRKVALTLKGGALGALFGAAAVFVVVMDREEKAFTMLSTPVATAPAPIAPAPLTVALAPPASSVPASPVPASSAPVAYKPAASAPVSRPPVSRPPVVAAAPASPAQTPSVTPRPAATQIAGGSPSVRFVPEAFALPAAVAVNPRLRGTISPPVAVAAPLNVVPENLAPQTPVQTPRLLLRRLPRRPKRLPSPRRKRSANRNLSGRCVQLRPSPNRAPPL